MADQNLNPFLLAAVTPDFDPRLLSLLDAKPELASRQDQHGYSLLHAAASYNHVELLRLLVNKFDVDINLRDEDAETCLFVAETVEVVKCLIEELHIDATIRNEDGLTATEKICTEQEFIEVGEYLRNLTDSTEGSTSGHGSTSSDYLGHPPPVPKDMNININTVSEDQLGLGQVDPVLRRRIEELAQKENFNSEEGQKELRDLITDALHGLNSDEREVRQRTE